MKSLILQLIRGILNRLPYQVARQILNLWLESLATSPNAKARLTQLLELDSDLTNWINQAAVRYGDGLHVKHRLMRYHDFFVERVQPGDRVLDIGCGQGALAYDVAAQAKATVTGIDINAANIAYAQQHYQHPKLHFIAGDALQYEFSEPFDVVILSNVLEHIDARVPFLRSLQAKLTPRCLLIRIPAIDRDWRVPLRAELGLFHFSDITHYTEYTQQSFEEELAAAELSPTYLQINWGEIWAEVLVKNLSV